MSFNPDVQIKRVTMAGQAGYSEILTLLADATTELQDAGLFASGDTVGGDLTPTQQLDAVIGTLIRDQSSQLFDALDRRSVITSVSMAVDPGNAQVGLSGSTVGGAAYLRFERGLTANGPWTPIGTAVAAKTITLTDTPLANATQFFYRLRAWNARRELYSSVRAATPIAPLTPMTKMRMRNFIVAIRNDSFPAVLRYRETGRTKVVVRNLDATDVSANRTVQVGYSTKENQYVQLPTTWVDIPAGSEFVDTSGRIDKLYVKTKTTNTVAGEVLVDVYAEVAIP